MKILRIRFHNLRNEEWFQLYTEFKDLVEASGASTLDIVALFATFLIFYNQADEALDLIRKSLDTDLMEEADMKRDHTYRGLADAVKSSLNHFNAAKKQAAEEVTLVIEHFGNLAAKAPNEETAGIYNLTQMLSDEYVAQVALLGLTDWVTELQQDNEAYETLVKARNDEVVARTKFRMKTVRREAEAVYRQIVTRLEAQTVLSDSPELEDFITKLNGFLLRYENVIAIRRGISGKITK
jgi:DNA-dependent RNA polymerase auxiliary subunit epsilon